ncbi:hypothetical protein AHF37_01214, partial [Paragonimus kellicotti]
FLLISDEFSDPPGVPVSPLTGSVRQLPSDTGTDMSTEFGAVQLVDEKEQLMPDAERSHDLREVDPPQFIKSQQCAVRISAYNSQWTFRSSGKRHLLNCNELFRLPKTTRVPLHTKTTAKKRAMITMDCYLLVVEAIASYITAAASLSENGQPMVFIKTMSPAEKSHSAVEKGAYLTVEAVRT